MDGPGADCAEGIEQAIELGADEVILPMVRSAAEVEQALEWVGGRCGLGILVETEDAVRGAAALGALPLSRVYVGLNDLMIDRGGSALFEPLVDGTVERVRDHFRVPSASRPDVADLGAGSVSAPDGRDGPSVRLRFLRRSFHRDVERG